MPHHPDPSRRRLVLGAVAVAAPLAVAHPARPARAASPTRLIPTPAQVEGPFYPGPRALRETDADLTRVGAVRYAAAPPLQLSGAVLDADGRPVPGATIEIWQCDGQGRYHHPGDGGRADPAFQGFGRLVTGRDGAYRFTTIQPVAYPGRPPHIHAKVRLGRRELLTTQFYLAGHPANARDFLFRGAGDADARGMLLLEVRREGDGLVAQRSVVVEI